MTAVFLQVRLSSQRYPRKALALLGDRTVFERCLQALSAVKTALHVVVTEPQSLAELSPLARALGWDVFSGPEDHVLERFVLAAREFRVTTVVRATGDNPLVSAHLANLLLARHLRKTSQYSGFQGRPLGSGVEFLDYSDDFSNILINSLEISYGATATVKIGDKLNFNNTEKAATVTITPANGEPLIWKIKASLYVNPYKGTWGIQNFRMKWDDWNGWGLSGEAEVALKMANAAPGIDDIITFGGIDGVDAAGAYYGVYERTSGANGKFGTYISSKGTDYSDKFGQLPNGKGKYFINPDNSVSVAIDGSTKKYNSNGSKTTDGVTMNFDLKASQIWTIDWNDYYGNENQFKMTYQLWYILKKQ